MVLTVFLGIICFVLLVRLLTLRQRLRKHELVSRLAELRRQLIALTHEDIISVHSHVFEYTYMSLELLIRIRYLNMLHMLPTTKTILRDASKRIVDNEFHIAKRELDDLLNGQHGESVRPFFKEAAETIFLAFFKSRVLLLLNLLARIGGARISASLRSLALFFRSVARLRTHLQNC